MILRKYALGAFMLFASICVIGCSGDDDPVAPLVPEVPRVETVVVSPEFATFTDIGEDRQFEAAAFDQEGAVIDTVFTWRSSDESVAFVGMNGSVVATGLGTAEIYVSAGSATDTAAVTVTLENAPLHEWIATGGGNWDEAANWGDGVVPGTGDVAMISAVGDYTVTLTGNVAVAGLILGAGSGTQILDINGNQLQTTTGGILTGGQLDVAGSFVVLGDFAWSGGTLTGGGLMEVRSGAELHAVGSPLELRVAVENRGAITVGAGASLRVNEMLECKIGAIIDLQGDAHVTVQNNGNLINAGTIRKSLGTEEASLTVSSAEFSSNGSLRVDEGTLHIRGGILRGTIEIDDSAKLRQSGATVLLGVNSQGNGPFVIGGTVELGTFTSDVISFRHLVLESAFTESITGPGSLLVDHIFVWRRGAIHELNSFTTQVGSQTTLVNSGTSVLSATTWNIIGDVSGDSTVDLMLANGAVLSVGNAGRWIQASAGSVSQGQGELGRFSVIGEFHLSGEGVFTVSTAFSCAGVLNLVESSIAVSGPFNLFDTGVITGGSVSEGTLANAQLTLVNSPSAVMSGTLRPDLGGEPAHMTINGNVDLQAGFVAEVDVSMSGDISTETIFFLRGGQELGGTVEVLVRDLPAEGTEFRVISTQSATGAMEVIFTGNNPFDEIVQDARGVLLRR